MRTIHVAALVAVRRGALLIVRKENTDRWMQPGGKPHEGEDLRETLQRELREELNVELQGVRYRGRYRTLPANEPDAELLADVFFGEVIGDPAPQAEIAEVRWADRNDLEALDLAPLIADCLPIRIPEASLQRPEPKLLQGLREVQPRWVPTLEPWTKDAMNEALFDWAIRVNLPADPTFGNLLHDLSFEGDRKTLHRGDRGVRFRWKDIEGFGIQPNEWLRVGWFNRNEFHRIRGEELEVALPRKWQCGEDQVLVAPEDDRWLLFFSPDGGLYYRSL